jgi:hypothetical protein
MLWRGVTAARRHEIGKHQKTMEYTYFLGLVVTGLLTFIPGRRMYFVAFGPAGATPGKLAVFAVIIFAIAVVGFLVRRWRRTPEGRAFVASH